MEPYTLYLMETLKLIILSTYGCKPLNKLKRLLF